GRWRFEGTTIPIAAIRSDLRYGRTATKAQYRFMDLTDDEIDAALAFEYPAVRPSSLDVEYASVIVQCVCGEDTSVTSLAPRAEVVECICGRTWRIVINSEQIRRIAAEEPGSRPH
ncbi:MAG TPA: hypothetical protein VFI12_09275, partial [Thermomicrobiales bacterium]|nr:hypothetical protein [Thermomicrobiales bacterium]